MRHTPWWVWLALGGMAGVYGLTFDTRPTPGLPDAALLALFVGIPLLGWLATVVAAFTHRLWWPLLAYLLLLGLYARWFLHAPWF